MVHNNAEAAWSISEGENIFLVIIDNGIGDLPEFPDQKRTIFGWPDAHSSWQPKGQHGSMVAAIASASTQLGGRYKGVAPKAKLISCKTNYKEEELCKIYRYLIALVKHNHIGRMVINNSYSIQTGDAPKIKYTDPLPKLIRQAVELGIIVVFSAGNNNVYRRSYHPKRYPFGTILGVNSMDEVICVGSVDENNQQDLPSIDRIGYNHCDSGRGPGQLAKYSIKPDCVAPTYGEVLWGRRYVTKQWWGTSGAAAQVSGLVALMLSVNPTLTPANVQKIIKATCRALPFPETHVGAGLINCHAAVVQAMR